MTAQELLAMTEEDWIRLSEEIDQRTLLNENVDYVDHIIGTQEDDFLDMNGMSDEEFEEAQGITETMNWIRANAKIREEKRKKV